MMSDLEFIDKEEFEGETALPDVPEQYGPLRRLDKEMRCVSTWTSRNGRNCGSSTFFKLNGIPTCMTHALMQLNHMYHELYERTQGNGTAGVRP